MEVMYNPNKIMILRNANWKFPREKETVLFAS